MNQDLQQEAKVTPTADIRANDSFSEMYCVTFEPVLRVGTMVHYVLPDYGVSHWSKGQHRPAVVVRIWDDAGMVQLQVFTDGHNDLESGENVLWCTSVHQDETTKAPGTWHWIEDPDRKIVDEVVHAN